MKAIITGATGGLGQNLVKFLKEKQWDILACGRNEKIGERLDVPFKSFDLCDIEAVFYHFEEADIVFHCAALSSPWGKYDEFYKANVQATQNVIDAMALHNIKKIVHVSTSSIYFDFTDRYNVKEDFLPEKFVNNYAKTKYEAEQVILNSSVYSVIIRPRGIFGEHDEVLIPRLEKVAKKGFLPVVSNSVTVDVTYVQNVVYAMYLASIKEVPSKLIFNITNDEPMEIKEIFSLVMKALNIKTHYKKIPHSLLMLIATCFEWGYRLFSKQEPPHTMYSMGLISTSQTLDITLAKEVLGYLPKYSIKEGVYKYAKYRNI